MKKSLLSLSALIILSGMSIKAGSPISGEFDQYLKGLANLRDALGTLRGKTELDVLDEKEPEKLSKYTEKLDKDIESVLQRIQKNEQDIRMQKNIIEKDFAEFRDALDTLHYKAELDEVLDEAKPAKPIELVKLEKKGEPAIITDMPVDSGSEAPGVTPTELASTITPVNPDEGSFDGKYDGVVVATQEIDLNDPNRTVEEWEKDVEESPVVVTEDATIVANNEVDANDPSRPLEEWEK